MLSSPGHIVQSLGNKARFREVAEQRGLLPLLPTHYASPATAVYPCILKAAEGAYGEGTSIVRSEAEAHAARAAGVASEWLLQELILGRVEYATSILCKGGVVLDAITTRYEYDADEYVWPHVKELRDRRSSSRDVARTHLDAMVAFLDGYNGICNFNYKIRADGTLCIFEVNTRVGADLACDVPAPWLRAFFEKLDA